MNDTDFSQTQSEPDGSLHGTHARRACRCAAELLLHLVVPPHTKGFHLLQTGMILLERQPRTRRIVLRDTLYPLLERHAGSEASAEHAIRDTIRLSRQCKTPPEQALFSDVGVPTNAEVLYALSTQLRKKLLERE